VTIITNQDWTSTTVGSLPAGWTAFGPSPSGWAVTATAIPNGTIPGPGADALKSPGLDGANCMFLGAPTATPDMDVRFDCGTDDWSLWPILRSNLANDTYYWFQTAGGNFIDAQKMVSGVSTRISFFNVGTIYSSGGKTSYRAQVIGSTVKFKFWPFGTSEPGTWNVTFTDTTITTGNYAGIHQQSGGSSNNLGGTFVLDDLQAVPSITVSPTSCLPGQTLTLTLTGSNVTWTPGTPGTPAFTVSAGTKNSQVVTSSTGATLNYTAADSLGTVTITDPGSGSTCTLSVTTATDFSVTPSSLTTAAGIQTGNYTVTLNGGLTTNETIALSDGGSGGTFTPSSLTFTSGNAGTPQTFKYTSSGSASGTISLQVAGTGQFGATHNVSNVIAAAITAGAAFATYVGATTVFLSASNATGGGGTYNYQWYRSISSGVLGSAISGQVAEACQDGSVSANTDYYYTMQYTDTSTSVTANSAQIHVKTLAATAIEVVGGIGDSIMGRLATGNETAFTSMLSQLNCKFAGSKQFTGVDRSISGTTSGDWVSGGADLPTAVAAFISAGVTRVVLMLGTNDSAAGTATSQATYQANILSAVTYMFANIPTLRTVHLFSSPFQALTSGNLSIQNCARLVAYSAALATIANGTTVFYSAPLASYNFFQKYPDQLSDGIHPGDQGVGSFGGLWASNVASDITPPVATAGYSRSRVVNA
jgi:hypothetical protein